MRRRLLLGYLSLATVVLLLLEVPLGVSFARRERDNLGANVQRDALALASLAEEGFDHPGAVDLSKLAGRYGTQTGANVSIVDETGRPVVTLHEHDIEASEAALRGQLGAALAGRTPRPTRFVDEGIALLGVVAPVGPSTPARGAVVITYPTATVDRRIRRNWVALGALALGILVVASGVGLGLARSITEPLVHLEHTASTLGSGHLAARADVTRGPPEVRALSGEFNEMADRLQELVDAQRVFVADASHQLRTPLTALRLRLESMESTLPPEARSDLEAATVESRRLARLVDGLLTLARAEGARAERQPIDVMGIVEQRRAAWSALAEERRVDLRTEPRRDRPRALAVPGHLDQIIDNLLANALEVAPPGSAVRLKVRVAGRVVAIHVTDQGPGMSEDERTHAFDRFWRGRGGTSSGGSGLGLAIVRQLASANGGSAVLDRGDDGGIDAVVTLQAA